MHSKSLKEQCPQIHDIQKKQIWGKLVNNLIQVTQKHETQYKGAKGTSLSRNQKLSKRKIIPFIIHFST